jgi:hypothetical protein
MPGPRDLFSAASVTATLTSMGAQEHRRADHAPYIAAVRRGIETCDIRVAEVQATISGDGRREARLTLRPDDSAFAEQVPGEASASWDEDNGWSLLARHGPLASCVHKGPGRGAGSPGRGRVGSCPADSPRADTQP